MKKRISEPQAPSSEELDEVMPEYEVRGGVRGKYASRYADGSNLVRLDPDVAEAFPDPVEVNAILRAVAGMIRKHGSAPSGSEATRPTA